MLRLLLLLLGAGLVAAAFRVPVAWIADGGRTLEGFWVGALGAASLALGVGWVRGWRRTAALTAALVVCLAAQRTATWPAWLEFWKVALWRLQEDPLLLGAWGVVGLQVLAAGRFAWRRRALVRELLEPFRRPAVLAGLGVLFLLSAAHLTRAFDPGRHALDVGALGGVLLQYAVSAVVLAANLVHLAALAGAMPADDLAAARRRLARSMSLPGEELPPTALDRALPFLLAGFALLASAALAVFALDRVPHVPDGIPYLFQARCLAAGVLSVPVPPVPEAFDVYLLDAVDGRLFGVTNPGWPAVLAVGVKLGAPWLVNPVLGGLAVLFVHGVVRRVADRGTAHVVALLAAASPWLLWISASFMTHALTLVLIAGGWLAVSTRRALPMLVGGLCMGLLLLVRPLEGVAVGTLTGLWLLGLGGRRAPLALVPVYALGCLGGAALLLLYNQALSGDPLAFPINAYLDRIWYEGANAIGFGPDRGNPPGWGAQDPLLGHGPWDVLYNTNQNVYNLNVELLGWASGSLLPALVHLLRGRFSRTDRAALAFLLTLTVVYNLYWFSGGSDYGARYWYSMLVPLLWLTLRGLGTLGALFEERHPGAAGRVHAVAGVSLLVALAVHVPWRAVAKYRDYRGYHGDFRELARTPGMAGALVLVEVGDASEYGLAFLENDLADPEAAVFAWARDEQTVERLRAAWPDRPVVRVAGRSAPRSPDGTETPGRAFVTAREAAGE